MPRYAGIAGVQMEVIPGEDYSPGAFKLLQTVGSSFPWVEPQDSPLMKNFLAAGKRVLGTPPVILESSGGLDNRFAPYFQPPSFSFGPSGGNHRRIDEYVEIPSLLRVTKTLAAFAAEWCGLTD